MRLSICLLFLPLVVSAASGNNPGRWEGSMQIPGSAYDLIVDLDQPNGKDWIGSIIIPGLGVKGAPTLQARDLKTGELLWNFETETSKQNRDWVLTKDRRFNDPLLYHSNWREDPLVAADRQFANGTIFSSPLVVNGVVYFGSTDGYLYALE